MSEIELSDYTVLCHPHEFKYLKEYIESVFPTNPIFFYNQTDLVPDGTYMVLRRVPILDTSPPPLNRLQMYRDGIKIPMHDYRMPRVSNKSIIAFLNLEHYTDDVTTMYNKMYLQPHMKIYDYSEDNVRISGEGIALPYKENKKETLLLQDYMNAEKTVDISLVGTCSERRDSIIEKLKEHFTVDYIQAFGEERDRRIGKSHILLNVHMFDNRKVYESIRCDRWRFAGMKILSETCLTPPPPGIITCEYDEIIPKLTELLKEIKNPV